MRNDRFRHPFALNTVYGVPFGAQQAQKGPHSHSICLCARSVFVIRLNAHTMHVRNSLYVLVVCLHYTIFVVALDNSRSSSLRSHQIRIFVIFAFSSFLSNGHLNVYRQALCALRYGNSVSALANINGEPHNVVRRAFITAAHLAPNQHLHNKRAHIHTTPVCPLNSGCFVGPERCAGTRIPA